MERKRDVVSSMTIFNLNINKALCLPENISTRIMLVYDKTKNVREFRILNSGINEDIDGRITSWLEENIEVEDIVHGLNSSEINADDFPKSISR